MIRRAAGHDADFSDRARLFVGNAQRVLADGVMLDVDVAGQRVGKHGRLFVDLFDHEMLKAALFRRLDVPFDVRAFLFKGCAELVEELDGVGAKARHVAVVEEIHVARVFEHGGNVACKKRAVLAFADDQRAVLAHAIKRIGFVDTHDGKRIRPFQHM